MFERVGARSNVDFPIHNYSVRRRNRVDDSGHPPLQVVVNVRRINWEFLNNLWSQSHNIRKLQNSSDRAGQLFGMSLDADCSATC
jgi:hypothetical protein